MRIDISKKGNGKIQVNSIIPDVKKMEVGMDNI
jgi:hypothetical protein